MYVTKAVKWIKYVGNLIIYSLKEAIITLSSKELSCIYIMEK